MRWHDLLHRHRRPAADAALDIDGVLAAGLVNQSEARRAIHELQRERKRLEREQRAIHAQSRRLTPVELRKIIHSDRGAAPELDVYQFSQALRDQNDQSTGSYRDTQMASLESRLQAINDALMQLQAYL